MEKEFTVANFVIAGVVKGGTTSIFSYLSHHPEIFVSKTKETGFFKDFKFSCNDEILPSELDIYSQNFVGYGDQKYIVEATAAYYLGGADVAKRVKQGIGPEGKVLIILREPVSRLVSFYKFKKNMLELDNNISFEYYVNTCRGFTEKQLAIESNNIYRGVSGGVYSVYLEAWMKEFGDSLHIVFFDSLVKDSKTTMVEIARWLKIDEKIFHHLNLSVENKTVAFKNKGLQQIALTINKYGEKFWRSNVKLKYVLRKAYYLLNSSKTSEPIDKDILFQLEQYYKPYNRNLYNLLKKYGYSKFPDWVSK